MDQWDGIDRRQITLTEEQINLIADRAAEKALEKVYATVGKSVLTRLLWVFGVVAIGLVVFLTGKGIIKLG